MSGGTVIPDNPIERPLVKESAAGGKTPAAANPKDPPKNTSAGRGSASSPVNALSARELFMQNAANLGFPRDSLSVTLLAFARFFSLTPDRALIAALRREILALEKASEPESAKEKAALEAKALALTAVLDKGVALDSRALERYARFFNLPAFTGDRESPQGSSPSNEGLPSHESVPSHEGDAPGGGNKRNRQDREELPEKEELKAIAEEGAKEDSLLDVLNSIPGKNRQYWLVFPFIINVRGTELRVFIRLLKKEALVFGENERLIIDIAGPKRQYRCFLEKKAGKFRADIKVYPELTTKALKSIRKEAEHLLGQAAGITEGFQGFDEIQVRNGGEMPSWTEDLYTEPLYSVNEEI